MTSHSTLTRAQFERASKALIAKHALSTSNSTALKGWSWAEHPTSPGLGYLSRTTLLQGCARNRDSDLLKDGVPESEDTVEDPAVAHSTLSESFTWGQSINFSPTFQVPVFYFTIHDSHGSPLTLEEIMDTSILRRHALPEIQVTPYALVQPDASFPLLSQGDHPTLGTPGWFIHPCGTACAMGELIGERKKAEAEAGGMPRVESDWVHWLETWFMMVENIVDLRGS